MAGSGSRPRTSSWEVRPGAGDWPAAGSSVDGSAPNFGYPLGHTLRLSGEGLVPAATFLVDSHRRTSSWEGVPVAGVQAAAGSAVDGSSLNFGDVFDHTLQGFGEGQVGAATLLTHRHRQTSSREGAPVTGPQHHRYPTFPRAAGSNPPLPGLTVTLPDTSAHPPKARGQTRPRPVSFRDPSPSIGRAIHG